ncbi:MAG: MerR family transcriptional regulator [Desertimonas sp.]
MPEPGAVHLSIGEVLGLLLEEFPDVTISKIRFLESQGLIEPERTPSGYRKFFDDDVELLRVILREQRENFLPLRVIKDRIDSGQIDPTPPRGSAAQADAAAELAKEVASHPSGGRSAPPRVPAGAAWAALGDRHRPTEPPAVGPPAAAPPAVEPPAVVADPPHDPRPVPASSVPAPPAAMPGVVVTRHELLSMAGVSAAELTQLEEYGIVQHRKGMADHYGDEAVEVASAAGAMLRDGVDARHLRAWRTSVEREAGLFEQLILPLMRHRNPQTRGQANSRLRELDGHSVTLRNALMRAALRRYTES